MVAEARQHLVFQVAETPEFLGRLLAHQRLEAVTVVAQGLDERGLHQVREHDQVHLCHRCGGGTREAAREEAQRCQGPLRVGFEPLPGIVKKRRRVLVALGPVRCPHQRVLRTRELCGQRGQRQRSQSASCPLDAYW